MLTDHFILISPLFQRLRERARIGEGGKERKGRRDSDREAERARVGGREGREEGRMGGGGWDGGRDRREASPELPATKPKN
jgi:hypothetical protein